MYKYVRMYLPTCKYKTTWHKNHSYAPWVYLQPVDAQPSSHSSEEHAAVVQDLDPKRTCDGLKGG
jgi:hypothetical protein